MKKNNIIRAAILVIGDFAVLYGSLLFALFLRYYRSSDPTPIAAHYMPFAVIFILWIFIFGSFGLYDLTFMKNGRRFLLRLLHAMGINFVLAILFFYLLPFFEIEPRRNLFLIAIIAALFLFLWRSLFNLFILKTPSSRVLFLGITKETNELAEFLSLHRQLGYQPVALAAFTNGSTPELPLPDASKETAVPHISLSGGIARTIQTLSVDTVVIPRGMKEDRAFIKMLFEVIPLGISIVEFTPFYEMITGKIPMPLIEEIWFIENLVGARKRMYEFFKRMLDILLAVALGIPALILSIPIAAAIRLDSPGPIFFRQKRVGRNGKEFEFIKFRSMIENAESIDGYKGNGHDLRHTRVGVVLRKTYLDEIPQIFNVLRGEMSFIGPRPERPQYVGELKKKIAFYEMRLLVKPGITGWAQIKM